MNVDNPDKKSVMMYVMCFFQVLPHSHIVVEELDELPSPTGTMSSTVNQSFSPNSSLVQTTMESTQNSSVVISEVIHTHMPIFLARTLPIFMVSNEGEEKSFEMIFSGRISYVNCAYI